MWFGRYFHGGAEPVACGEQRPELMKWSVEDFETMCSCVDAHAPLCVRILMLELLYNESWALFMFHNKFQFKAHFQWCPKFETVFVLCNLKFSWFYYLYK